MWANPSKIDMVRTGKFMGTPMWNTDILLMLTTKDPSIAQVILAIFSSPFLQLSQRRKPVADEVRLRRASHVVRCTLVDAPLSLVEYQQ